MKNQIKTGDTVRVEIHSIGECLCYEAEVLYIPRAIGDCWQFKDLINPRIVYTSEPCTITLLKSKEDKS